MGFQFFYCDFNTVKLSKSTSLFNIIQQKQWTKPIAMQSGFGLFFTENLSKKIDGSLTLNAAWIDYPDRNNNYKLKNWLLVELNPSIQYNMFPGNKIINPFLNTGFSIQAYSSHFGLLADIGLGINFSLFSESNVNPRIQYRHPLTNSVTGHFFYSIGINTLIRERKVAKKKDKLNEVVMINKYTEVDTDKDGILDVNDFCPDVFGEKDFHGCPEIKQDVVSKDSLKEKNNLVKVLEVKDSSISNIPKQSSIYFEFSKASIIKGDTIFLNNVFAYLRDNPKSILNLLGHTDNVGSVEYNYKLSVQRSQSIKSYLILKGISSNRIFIKGFGKSMPIFPNINKIGRHKNRRVEFVFSNSVL